MATTDPKFNPSGSPLIAEIKGQAADLSGSMLANCPDNHVRQIALDHLRIATAMAVQSFFEDDD